MLRGFDISAYQGAEDLAVMVPTYALDFVICRAWQSNSQRDPAFPRYWRQLADLDVVRGAYAFAHSGTNATTSADRFCDYVLEQGTRPTDLLVLDLESNLGNLSAPALAAWGTTWAKRVKVRCPEFSPVYYGGYPVHPQYRDMAQHFSAWWWARYPSALSMRTAWPKQMMAPAVHYWPSDPQIWQFSQDYPVGPNDPHDANISSLTRDQLRSLNPGADMPLTPDEIKAIGAEVWAATFGETDGADVAVMLQRAYHNSATALARTDALVAKVEALTVALGQAGGAPVLASGLSVDDVRTAVADIVGRTTITTSSTLTTP